MAQVQIDEELLDELGFGDFPELEKEAILTKMLQHLELRMGMRVADMLSEDQLIEFNKLTDAGKDEEAQKWIREAVPNYEEIANEELDKYKKIIKGELSVTALADKQPADESMIDIPN